MEKQQPSGDQNQGFSDPRMRFMNVNGNLHYVDMFKASQYNQRAHFNIFEQCDESNKMSNCMFLDEFPSQNITNNELANDYKFEFGPCNLKDSKLNFEDPFNFNFEYESPEEVLSYQPELLNEFELSNVSPKQLSYDHVYYQKLAERKNQEGQIELGEIDNEIQIPTLEELKNLNEKAVDMSPFDSNLLDSRGENPFSQISCDSAKLEELIKCLSKSKGVNKQQISNDIVARTIEFGQKKVADELNIPYRRYKSILNKVGIKTNAGRKIKNLQLETKLIDYAIEIKEAQLILTRSMIKDQASNIITELVDSGDVSLKKIRLSKGWLDKFIKRHEIISNYITSQKGKKGL